MQRGPNYRRDFERCPQARGKQREYFVWLTAPAVATRADGGVSEGLSSSAGICVACSGGVVYEQAVPKDQRKDLDKEKVRREMYERQKDANGAFRPGPCSKFEPAKMREQATLHSFI